MVCENWTTVRGKGEGGSPNAPSNHVIRSGYREVGGYLSKWIAVQSVKYDVLLLGLLFVTQASLTKFATR